MYLDYKESSRTWEGTYIENCIDRSLDELGDSAETRIKTLQNLHVTLPIEKIKEIFHKTGLIQLRDVAESDKLLLGCGNCPIVPLLTKGHEHKGFITINPDISMNPTVVGAFGHNKGLSQILPKEHFKDLYGEHVTLATSADDLLKETFDSLKKGFKLLSIDNQTGEITEEENLNNSQFILND